MISGRAGSLAETAFRIFFSVKGILVSSFTFSLRISTGPNRNIQVPYLVHINPDAGPGWIEVAVFRDSMQCGASHFTGPATRAFIDIHFYLSDDFFGALIFHGCHPSCV
jgi:hypothetical protein